MTAISRETIEAIRANAKMMGREQLAEMFGVTPRTIKRICQKHKIPARDEIKYRPAQHVVARVPNEARNPIIPPAPRYANAFDWQLGDPPLGRSALDQRRASA